MTTLTIGSRVEYIGDTEGWEHRKGVQAIVLENPICTYPPDNEWSVKVRFQDEQRSRYALLDSLILKE